MSLSTGPTEARAAWMGGLVCWLSEPGTPVCVQAHDEPGWIGAIFSITLLKKFGGNDFYPSVMTYSEVHMPKVCVPTGFYLCITRRQSSRTFTDPRGHLMPLTGQYLAREGKDVPFLVRGGPMMCFASVLASCGCGIPQGAPFLSDSFCSGRVFRTRPCHGVCHSFSFDCRVEFHCVNKPQFAQPFSC